MRLFGRRQICKICTVNKRTPKWILLSVYEYSYTTIAPDRLVCFIIVTNSLLRPFTIARNNGQRIISNSRNLERTRFKLRHDISHALCQLLSSCGKIKCLSWRQLRDSLTLVVSAGTPRPYKHDVVEATQMVKEAEVVYHCRQVSSICDGLFAKGADATLFLHLCKL